MIFHGQDMTDKDYSKLNIEGVGSYSSVQYVCTLVYMALFYAQGGDKKQF